MFNSRPRGGTFVASANFCGDSCMIVSPQHDVKQLAKFLKMDRLALVSWYRPALALWRDGVRRGRLCRRQPGFGCSLRRVGGRLCQHRAESACLLPSLKARQH